MFGFDFQFAFAGCANPVVFAINIGVVMDAFAIVFGTEITLHTKSILPHYRLFLLGGRAKHDQVDPAVCTAAFRRAV